MRLKLIAIIALIGGPIAAITGISQKKTFDQIKATGIEVPGTLEKGESSKRKGVTSYKFDVAFTTKDGKPMLKNMSLPSSFVKPRLSGDSIANWDVTVKYLPSDPKECFVVGAENDPSEIIYGGGAAGVLGLAGTLWMLKKRKAGMA
jgi:hypothetical protein